VEDSENLNKSSNNLLCPKEWYISFDTRFTNDLYLDKHDTFSMRSGTEMNIMCSDFILLTCRNREDEQKYTFLIPNNKTYNNVRDVKRIVRFMWRDYHYTLI
jgi:hypothetical protein